MKIELARVLDHLNSKSLTCVICGQPLPKPVQLGEKTLVMIYRENHLELVHVNCWGRKHGESVNFCG